MIYCLIFWKVPPSILFSSYFKVFQDSGKFQPALVTTTS